MATLNLPVEDYSDERIHQELTRFSEFYLLACEKGQQDSGLAKTLMSCMEQLANERILRQGCPF